MSLESIPATAWWIAGSLVALIVIFGVCVVTRWAYRRLSRRHLVQVVSRREGVRASSAALESVIESRDRALDATGNAAARLAAENQRTLVDIARRMEIVAEELDTMPLPRSLWPAAGALADAAAIIAEEAGRVGESEDPRAVFAAVDRIDALRASAALAAADESVKIASVRYGLDEARVYGGGLYI